LVFEVDGGGLTDLIGGGGFGDETEDGEGKVRLGGGGGERSREEERKKKSVHEAEQNARRLVFDKNKCFFQHF
jgi:hypothetical protein